MRKLLALAAAATLVLAACGRGGDDSDPLATADGRPAPQATTGGGGHQHGGGGTICTPSGTNLRITASGTRFDTACLAAPAGQAFTITYDNKDTLAHSIAILESHTATEVLFRSEIATGPRTITLDVPALKAGTFAFHCEVHPNDMRGTFVVK